MTTQLTVAGTQDTLLTHFALYGLASIIDAAGHDVNLQWTLATEPRPVLTCDLKESEIGEAVASHARAAGRSWVAEDVQLKGSQRGLMSPRLTFIPAAGKAETGDADWPEFQRRRHEVLDQLSSQHSFLDLRMISCLGEPAYWSRNPKGDVLQDDGASRLEMQPRNIGSEFVGSRLRKLAATVSGWPADDVVAGITGRRVSDEAEKNKPDSRTPTGFAQPGPTDNALAWCALWGISCFPVAPRVSRARHRGLSVTSGHLGRGREEWFYVPMWHQPWTLGRARSVLASSALKATAAESSEGADRSSPAALAAAQGWLASRGVRAVIRFPIRRYGTDKAPERRALGGKVIVVR